MKAQRTCLIRAKNIMPLSFYSFIWRYIRHKSRLPSRQATTSLCSLHHVTLTIRLRFAKRLRLRLQSVLHHTWLENSEWCSHTHTMLLTRNPRFTQQTIMQPLYVTLFIMLRGYRDSFQICGRQNRDPANPKSSRSTYAKRVFISGRGPTAKNKRWKTTSLSSRWAVTSTSFSLGFSNK